MVGIFPVYSFIENPFLTERGTNYRRHPVAGQGARVRKVIGAWRMLAGTMTPRDDAKAKAKERKLVVAALVRDAAGRVLLTQRRADQPMPLKWELPGGKIEPGEAPTAALAREVEEELGCLAEVGTIDEVIFHPYADFDLLMLVYRCTLRGTPRAREVAALAWVAPSELGGYDLLPADRPLADRLALEARAAVVRPV
jgi:8-oxo-dGTP diphosphatase